MNKVKKYLNNFQIFFEQNSFFFEQSSFTMNKVHPQ